MQFFLALKIVKFKLLKLLSLYIIKLLFPKMQHQENLGIQISLHWFNEIIFWQYFDNLILLTTKQKVLMYFEKLKNDFCFKKSEFHKP